MVVRLIFHFFLIILPALVRAQAGFNLFHFFSPPHDTPSGYFGVLEENDTLFMIAQSADTELGRYGINFVIADTNGTVMKNQFFTVDTSLNWIGIGIRSNIVRLQDGSFVCIGFHGASGVTNYLIKCSPTNGSVHVTTFADTLVAYGGPKELIQLDDCIMGFGLQQEIIGQQSYYSCLAYKFNFDGELLWEKVFSLPQSISAYYRTATIFKDSLLAIGYSQLTPDVPWMPAHFTRNGIFIIDTAGALISHWEGPENQNYVYDKLIYHENKWIYSGYDLIGTSERRNSVGALSDDFDPLWRQTPDSTVVPIFLEPNEIKVDQNNQIWCFTHTFGDNPEPIAGAYPVYIGAKVTKLKTNGDWIWKRSVLPPYCPVTAFPDGTPKDFTVLENGSFIGCGFARYACDSNEIEKPWLFKLEPDGCLDTICPTYNPSLTLNEPIAFVGLSVFPNPADHEVHIALPLSILLNSDILLQIFDYSSKMVASGVVDPGQSQIYVKTENLPAGLYVVRLTSESGFLGEEKLVIIR
jgi:Secretion system C-terminal sorting domain